MIDNNYYNTEINITLKSFMRKAAGLQCKTALKYK